MRLVHHVACEIKFQPWHPVRSWFIRVPARFCLSPAYRLALVALPFFLPRDVTVTRAT